MFLDGTTASASDLLFRHEVVKQKKKVRKTKAGNVVEDSITKCLNRLKDKKQMLEKIGATAEEVQGIKDDMHLLKLNRAKLRGSLLARVGILPIWENSSKARQPPANASIDTREEKKEEHSARVL
jgi:hypothetical protein